MSELLSRLNDPQKKAVTTEDGPILIFAGAGSGKTNVLTRRIAYLILERQVRPYQILAVTFTNKAASEMKDRIAALIGGDVIRELWAGTFHSICARMLRERGKEIGLKSTFVIYDDSDQINLVKQVLKELDLDPHTYAPRPVLGRISKAKEKLTTPARLRDGDGPTSYFDRAVDRVYERYQKKLAESNALDFDDLIVKAVELLDTSQTAREHYQRRFEYVHCDEFQDTNEGQYRLLKILSQRTRNLCVVGDDDQSIYAFRGADVNIILNFERDFPDALVVKLEQNYRSTRTILDAAYHVVKNNTARAEKRLWTDKEEGEHINLIEAPNENEEALAIASMIERAVHDDNRNYREIAILYRTNAQSRAIEEQLGRFDIPYKVVGGVRFYQRREIKDALSYLRVIANPYDSVSHRRVINVPHRGIGDTTVERLAQFAVDEGLTFWDALREAGRTDLGPKAKKSVAAYIALIDYLQRQAESRSVAALIEETINASGYRGDIEKEHTADAQSRLENLAELISVAREFEQTATSDQDATLIAFLEQVSLVADVDSYAESDNVVNLMTLHSAKGLEFTEVFLAGMEESIFPHMRASERRADMEEERRLCYVGITRAKERLTLSYAGARMTGGITRRNAVSRFIAEIPGRLYVARGSRPRGAEAYGSTYDFQARRSEAAVAPRWSDLRSASETKAASGRTTGAAAVNLPYRVGEKVSHEKFGKGTVVTIAPDGAGDAKVTVAFPAPVGIKTLMAGFAKLIKA